MRFAAGTAASTDTHACEIDVAVLGRVRKIGLVKLWKWEPQNLPSVIHSIRTAIAATISLAVARLFELPEGCSGGRVARDSPILQPTRLPLQKIG
jgi:hypothetical protein